MRHNSDVLIIRAFMMVDSGNCSERSLKAI